MAKKGFGNSMGGQVHSALMDEFKKAHRKMFKNGFVETDHQKLHQQQSEDEHEPDKISSVVVISNDEENSNDHKLEVRKTYLMGCFFIHEKFFPHSVLRAEFL